MRKTILIIVLTVILPVFAAAQGTGFNFQGRLNDGANPANGSYDLQFRLFNAIMGGNPIGTVAERPNTPLINGVFSVSLDFGPTAFNNPNAVFIEIAVKPSGSPNAFTILGPRQQLTVVPFAVRANSATNADNATTAVSAASAANAANAANSNTLNGLSSSDFIRNSVAPVANQNFNIVGNGVINGTLNVAGETTVGSPTITSNLNVSGNVTAAGNVAQNRDKGGLVKAMAFIEANGTIVRCYNAFTGSSTGNCGLTSEFMGQGFYDITFPFQVNDRFVAVTARQTFQVFTGVNIGTGFLFQTNPNVIRVRTFITDVDFKNSDAENAFMIIVY